MDVEKLKRQAKLEKLKELRKLMLKKMVESEDKELDVAEMLGEETAEEEPEVDEDLLEEKKEFMRSSGSLPPIGKTKILIGMMAKPAAESKPFKKKR